VRFLTVFLSLPAAAAAVLLQQLQTMICFGLPEVWTPRSHGLCPQYASFSVPVPEGMPSLLVPLPLHPARMSTMDHLLLHLQLLQ